MKICVLCEFMTGKYKEGTQIITLEMSKALKEHGHEPVILAPIWREGDEKIKSEIEVQTFSVWGMNNPFIRILLYAFSGIKLHKKHDFDLFMGLYTLPTSIASMILGIILRKKKVIVIWEPVACEKAKKIPFLDSLFRKADGILTMTTAVKNLIITSFSVPHNFVTVIPGFYDSKLFLPREKDKTLVETYGLENKFVLLFVGRISRLKGVPQLIEAIKEVDDVKVLLVGREVEHENFRGMVSEWGVSDKVVFVGYKKHETLPKFYQTCDCFVLPSLNEGFALVVAEAMACGKPVIVSDAAPLPEVAGEAGITFRAGNAEELKSAILQLKTSPEKLRILSENAITQSKKFNKDRTMEQYVEFFEELG